MRRSIRYLRKIGEHIRCGPGDYIASSLEREYLYILTTGSVRVERVLSGMDDPIFLFRLESAPPRNPTIAINPAGFYVKPSIGDESFLVDYHAETECRVYRISNDFLRGKIDPKYKDGFHHWLGRQMNWQNLHLLSRIEQASLCNEWVILQKLRSLVPRGKPSVIKINRTALARELATTRETVSKQLARLERSGKVTRLQGRQVLVHPWAQ